jgi:hypothetical protein
MDVTRCIATIDFHFGICLRLRYQAGVELQYRSDFIFYFTKLSLNRRHFVSSLGVYSMCESRGARGRDF